MAIPLKHDRHDEPVPQQAASNPEPASPKRRPMQRAARGKRKAPGEQGAPEYYAKDQMPSVAKPGPRDDDA